MSYVVLDLETTMQYGGYGRDSNPFFDKILCIGLKYDFVGQNCGYRDGRSKSISDTLKTFALDYLPSGAINTKDMIIAHNAKFDLLFLWRNDEIQDFFKRGGRIFDTQLAEYIISGQRHKYPALRNIAVNNYGCKERVKHIEGKKTQDVDIKLLLEDVRNDVLDTEQVVLKQLKVLKQEGMFNLTLSQMDAVLATTEMEYNGMYINQDILDNNCKDLQQQLTKNQQDLESTIKKCWPDNLTFNSDSPAQVAKLFFGGTLKSKVSQVLLDELGNPIKYKTGKNKGQDKTKNVNIDLVIVGMGEKPHKDWLTPGGSISTNDKVLSALARKDNEAGQLAKSILEIRYINKQINTYYTGFKSLLYPFDGCLRGQLSHCGYETKEEVRGGTNTGRLSSAKPNLQNIPRAGTSKVKEHFTSRYGEDGVIIEADFKQMEVIAFAVLTQDPQLLEDLATGFDLHVIGVENLFNVKKEDVSKEKFDELRTRAKPATFLLIYGGSAFKLAKEHNLELEFCEKYVEAFWARYPTAKQWQENLIASVKATERDIEEYTAKGFKKREGYLQNITGRKLYFKTDDIPEFMLEKRLKKLGLSLATTKEKISSIGYKEYWTKFREAYGDWGMTGFNPPEIKDYPVQSFATSDIVLITLGLIWRKAINNRNKYLLINTVHDSILFDCKKEFVVDCCNMIQDSVYSIKEELKKLFNINFNLSITVDIKVGKSWGELKIYKPELEEVK